MHHFTAETCKTFLQNKDLFEIYRRCIVNCAVHHPFLMYEVLAISALHLGRFRPESLHFYTDVASSFQARALAGLDNILTQVNASNCQVVLFFSHLISMHSFYHIFTSAAYDASSTNIIDGLVQSMSLSRGIQAIINPWWHTLLESDMAPIMRDADSRRSRLCKRQGDETRDLIELVDSTDIGEASRDIYRDAIIKLQRDFDEMESLTAAQLATTNTAFAWLVTSSSGYATLLDEQRPEALVILSYFAVILHRRRKCWIISDSGRILVNMISSRLGRRWAPHLMWPRSQVLGLEESDQTSASRINSSFMYPSE